MAEFAQLREAALDRAGLVQRPLGIPDVEVRAERVEHRLLMRELQPVADFAKFCAPLVFRQVDDFRVGLDDFTGELVNVLAVVAVVGNRLTDSRRLEGRAEALHLHAAVVDVELAGDLRPGGRQHPADRVANRRPASVAKVQRTGRVGRDELKVDLLAAQGVGAAVRLAGLDDRARQLALRGRVERDVEEPRARDVDHGDAGRASKPPRDQLGDLAGTSRRRLGKLQRHIRGVVAELLALGPLDRNARRHLYRKVVIGNRGGNRGKNRIG